MKRESIFKRLPNRVKVGDSVYSISYVDKIDKDDTLFGICHLWKKKIKICKRQPLDQIHSTLLHEILHAVAFEFGFKLKERKVRQLEGGLVKMFRKNGWNIGKDQTEAQAGKKRRKK